MRKIFSILALTISLVACSQTQTFNSPPKFKNVVRNDANTKILSINGSNLLQWVDKSTIVANSFPEAPIDGQQYARKNATWEVVSSSSIIKNKARVVVSFHTAGYINIAYNDTGIALTLTNTTTTQGSLTIPIIQTNLPYGGFIPELNAYASTLIGSISSFQIKSSTLCEVNPQPVSNTNPCPYVYEVKVYANYNNGNGDIAFYLQKRDLNTGIITYPITSEYQYYGFDFSIEYFKN
jgi:hypothetical protein